MNKLKNLGLLDVGKTDLSLDCIAQITDLAHSVTDISSDQPDIHAKLADVDGLLVGYRAIVNANHIDAAPALTYIGLLGTAFHRVDVARATEKEIPVSNVVGYSTEAVAEFTISAIVAANRGLNKAQTMATTEEYIATGITPREIRDSNFGVIGLGRIGSRVADIADGFGANVSYWSRNDKDTTHAAQELDTLIAESDFLTLHTALTPDTNKILSADRIKSLRQGALVINTCPMGLVDIDALDERLSDNDITFIFDHSIDMPQEEKQRLARHPTCVTYPTIAYLTKEAQLKQQDIIVANMKAMLAGQPQNTVEAN